MKKNYKFNTLKLSSSQKIIPAGQTDETIHNAYNTGSLVTNGSIIVKGGLNISNASFIESESKLKYKGSSLAGTISFEKTNENIGREYSFYGYIDNDGNKVDFGGDKGQKGQKGQKGLKGQKGQKGQKGLKGIKGFIGDEGVPFQIIFHGNLNDDNIKDPQIPFPTKDQNPGPFGPYDFTSTDSSLIRFVENNCYPIYKYKLDGSIVVEFYRLEGNEPFNPNGHLTWEPHFIYTQVIDKDVRTILNNSVINYTQKYLQISSKSEGWIENTNIGLYGLSQHIIAYNGIYWDDYGQFIGTKGKKGQKGQNGQKGDKGIIGDKGNKGNKGIKGQKGEGTKGDKGIKGKKGDKGLKGEKGIFTKGNKGQKGEKGFKGNKGDKGVKGTKGQKGGKGKKGDQAIFNCIKDCTEKDSAYQVNNNLNFLKGADTPEKTFFNISNVNNIILGHNNDNNFIGCVKKLDNNNNIFSGLIVDNNNGILSYSSNNIDIDDVDIITGGSISNYDINDSLFTMGSDTKTNDFLIKWYVKGNDSKYKWYSHTLKNGSSDSFTGQHIVYPEDNIIHQELDQNVGKIVCSSNKYNNYTNIDKKSDINNGLPVVRLSNKEYSKNVFGVITDKINNDKLKYVENDFYKKGYILVNSLGDGGIWIYNNINKIENGDYIVTSSIPGIGMKQNDDIRHNYTVAKITQDFDFNNDKSVDIIYNDIKYKIAFVGCIYCM